MPPSETFRYIEPPVEMLADGQAEAIAKRVIAAEIHGRLAATDMRSLSERLQEIDTSDRKANLMIDMQHYAGYEFGVVVEKLKDMPLLWRAIDRYAVIGAKRWMEIWIDIVNPITPQELRHFSPEEKNAAWEWLLQADAD